MHLTFKLFSVKDLVTDVVGDRVIYLLAGWLTDSLTDKPSG